MTRILVVDDEERICRFLSRALRAQRYDVDCVGSGPAALLAVHDHGYDLIVLDLMLPGIPGIEVLRRLLAEDPGRRVLVLSAVTGIDTRVSCLEAGAADYLAKPFALAELLARIRSRIREPAPPGAAPSGAAPSGAAPSGAVPPGQPPPVEPAPEPGRDLLRAGAVEVDTLRRSVTIEGRSRPLSEREYALLLHLIRHAGRVCTREQLLADVWGYDFDPGTNIVDVYIRRLRSKLGDVQKIETVRNVGYSLVLA
jgi:two-component system, OmpR family, response regulator